ncbi:MAG: iron-containing alcohol dehydrogenase [Clostridium sp.]
MKLNLKTDTNIVYGRGILEKYGKEMLKLGEKPLIITGKKSSKNSQGYKEIIEFLKKNKKECSIYVKEGNVGHINDCKASRKILEEENCDYIIGIGGGNTLDIAKYVGANKKMHVCAIPTISGSGAETSKYGYIYTKNGIKIVEKTIDMAIIDPYYTNKININDVKNSSINALSNLIEGYLNIDINKENEKIAIEGLRRFGESIDNILDSNISARDRENLSMASVLGGILLDRYGRSMFDILGETLSEHEGIGLGFSKGLLYTEYLKKFRKERKLNNIINVLGFSTFRDLGKTINKMSNYEKFSLEKIEIDIISNIAMEKITEGNKKLKNEVYYEIFNIYSNSLKNRELNYDII